MATMGFTFNDGEAGNVSEVCWKSNHRTNEATPVDAILAEADLPTVSTRATQLSTMAMEKSLGMPDTNPRKQIATAEVLQHTKRASWRQKDSKVWRSIFGSTPPERTPGLLPPWLQTGSHIFELDGVKSGESEKVKIWALQRLVNDWSSYDLAIYMNCSAIKTVQQ